MTLYAILVGFIMDLIIGDPHWMYHPVRAIGKLITVLETMLRKIFSKTQIRAGLFENGNPELFMMIHLTTAKAA